MQILQHFQLNPESATMKSAVNALKRIQKHIPEAIIAGGYVRDQIFGVKSKDIDIFIPHMGDIDIDSIMYQLKADEMHGASYMPQSEITRIWNDYTIDTIDTTRDSFSFGSTIPVQYIMLAEGLRLVDRIPQYDFGFCQCWFDGTFTYVTDEFLKDYVNQTFTLTFCEDQVQFDRSMRRAERFKKRFPNLVFKIAPEIESKFIKLELEFD